MTRHTHPFFFSSLLRLRGELTRLIVAQSSKMKDPAQSASYQSTMYEMLLQALSVSKCTFFPIKAFQMF